MGFFTGTKPKFKQYSNLLPGQQPNYQNLQNAVQGAGAGGAFGQSADYYRDLLSNDSQTFNAFQAPEMRRFNEEIIPGLSEQFAGMGSGALSSSGFRNAAVNAGSDLSERLGAIRAQLRSQGAAGLAGLGQQSLGQYSQNVYHPGTEGFIDQIGPAIGAGLTAAGGAFGGPLGAAVGNFAGNAFTGQTSKKGKSDWFGKMPQSGGNVSGNYNLPTFGGY